ncbi:MAG: hypothetical protein EZS28_051526, partial [Streblomastix strix]
MVPALPNVVLTEAKVIVNVTDQKEPL